MITAHPDAPMGSVICLAKYRSETFGKNTAVLCRNTAPLVALAYGMLYRDVPCIILGKDLGVALQNTVKKMRAVSLIDLRDKLGTWVQRESARAESEGRDPSRVEDQYQCLMFFIRTLDEDCQSIADLDAKINMLFSDDSVGGRVVLSTVHKAKGLEYDTVFILDKAKLMPSRYAKLPWQIEQEKNLIYVAITRARVALYYINSECWDENEAF